MPQGGIFIIIIPREQMRKLRQKEVKKSGQGHPIADGRAVI